MGEGNILSERNLKFDTIIKLFMFLYIFSLYFLTYQPKLNNISNLLGFAFIGLIWLDFLANKKDFYFDKTLIFYLTFIFFVLASSFIALRQDLVINMSRTLMLLFLMGISLANYIDEYIKIKKIMKYFIWSASIASIYIIVNADFSNLTRYGSELGNVNAIGIILGIGLTFVFYFIFEEKKFIYLSSLFVILPTIILTGSRKSFLFVFMNILIVLFLKNKDNWKKILKFIISASIIILLGYYLTFNIPIFYEILGERIKNLFNFFSHEGTSEGSINTRWIMIKFGYEIFKKRPLFGYGIGNFAVAYAQKIGGVFTYSHNNFIELLTGIGIFGTIIYYYMQIRLIFILCLNSKYKNLNYYFLAILFSYIVLSVGLIYYYSKHFMIVLILASLVSQLERKDIKGSNESIIFEE